MTERNERNTRTHAIVLAIGLHLSLGFLLYTHMSGGETPKQLTPTKVNVSKETPVPAPQAVSNRQTP